MPPDVAAGGEAAHFRALERLYRAAPINGGFQSTLEVVEPGFARIRFAVDPAHFHAAGAAHGTLYFKMMDDAAFYACNSTVSDRFLLTTGFNLVFSRPLKGGEAVAEGRWISGRRRVLIGEARLIDAKGEEAARGTGTFMRSHIALSGLARLSRRMTVRLTSSVFVSGLLRLAEREGGFGAVVTKGDANAGAVLILLAERGLPAMLLERLLQPDGNYRWDSPLATAKNPEDVDRFLARRRKFDPDCWVVELDIASAERFAAEIRALD